MEQNGFFENWLFFRFQVSKDFFGRITTKETVLSVQEGILQFKFFIANDWMSFIKFVYLRILFYRRNRYHSEKSYLVSLQGRIQQCCSERCYAFRLDVSPIVIFTDKLVNVLFKSLLLVHQLFYLECKRNPVENQYTNWICALKESIFLQAEKWMSKLFNVPTLIS